MTPDAGVRIRVNATTAALIFSLLGAGSGAVWAAAKITSGLESLQIAVRRLDQTVGVFGAGMQSLDKRVTVLEDRDARPANPFHPEPSR